MFNFPTSGIQQQAGGNLTGRTSVLEASSGMPMSAGPRGAGPFWEPRAAPWDWKILPTFTIYLWQM